MLTGSREPGKSEDAMTHPDPDDGEYICPNDMLLGRASSEVPQGPVKETSNSRHRVEFVQRSVQVF